MQEAQRRADELSSTGVLAHSDDLWRGIYPTAIRTGENVGVGPDIEGIHLAFMDSPPHRANILGAWQWAGVGVTFDGTRYWVVQLFAT